MNVRSLPNTASKELHEFLPISWGWLKFLGGLMNMLALIGLLCLGMHYVFTATSFLPEGLHMLIGGVGGVVLLSTIVHHFTRGAREVWILNYFARNVRGYVARFFVPEGPNLQRWWVNVVTSEQDPANPDPMTALGGLMIEVRLSGWFPWGETSILQDGKPIGHIHSLRNWSVRLHSVNWLGAVHVRVVYKYLDTAESVELDVADALRLLDFVRTSRNVMSIGGALNEYRRSLQDSQDEVSRLTALYHEVDGNLMAALNNGERLKGERDAAQSADKLNNVEVKRLTSEGEIKDAEIERINGRLHDAAELLDTIAAQLHTLHYAFDQSQRLKTRIEALKIWLDLLSVITDLHTKLKSADWSAWNVQRIMVEQRLRDAHEADRKKRLAKSRAAS